MNVACPSCASQLEVGPDMEGRRVKCPRCAGIFEAPPPVVEVETVDESATVACPSCAGPLTLRESLRGKRVRCPRCKAIFAMPAEAPQQEEAAYQVVPEDAPLVVEPETLAVLPPTVTKRRQVDDFMDDIEDNLPPREDRRMRREAMRGEQNASWLWWACGGGAFVAIEFVLLVLAIAVPSGHILKAMAAYLFIVLPVSTLAFVVAMYISSIWFEAFDFGELQVTLVKAFVLVTIASVVSLFPYGGFILAFFVWCVGIMMLFKLDLWETRLLIALNWLVS
ncbi:MAG TPA: hypothetical protein VFE62_19105, partial [Gemmataceae bacterium]|nr:hypothetical protein [Gemmataceae bacterium]